MQDHTGPNGTIRDHTGPYGTKWDQTGPYGTIWDHTGPCGTIRDHMGPYGAIWDLMGHYWTLLYLTRSYGTLRDLMGPYMTIDLTIFARNCSCKYFLTDFLTYWLTLAISKGAFTPKKLKQDENIGLFTMLPVDTWMVTNYNPAAHTETARHLKQGKNWVLYTVWDISWNLFVLTLFRFRVALFQIPMLL